MNDWRKIEAAIADFFDREGFDTAKGGGDYMVEVGPAQCVLAMAGDVCPGVRGGGEINITKLARELADVMAKA
jgi:hypothetical protein